MKGTVEMRIIRRTALLASFAGLALLFAPAAYAQSPSDSDDSFNSATRYGDFYENTTSVGAEYAGTAGVWNGAGTDYAHFFEQEPWAGENGVGDSGTGAFTDDSGAYYWQGNGSAGEEGAFQESTEGAFSGEWDDGGSAFENYSYGTDDDY